MAPTVGLRDIVNVASRNVPSSADLIFLVVAPVTAFLRTVKLTQSDGDLAAHIRMGDAILTTGILPGHSLASYTAATDTMVAQAWLSEVVFSVLHRLGGLPLLVVVTAILIAATHASVAIFLRRKGADPRWALLAALISLAISSTHWLTRPHMFSITGVLLTLYVLESGSNRKWLAFLVLYGLWANLHGAWLYGLVVCVLYVAGGLAEAVFDSRARVSWLLGVRSNVTGLGAAALGTLMTPHGLRLNGEVLRSATDPAIASHMAEFLPPNFQEAAALPFLGATLLSVTILAVARERMPLPWLAVVVFGFFASLSSFRNIALFGVSAWPLIALHASRALPPARRKFPFFREFAALDHESRVGILAGPVAILLLLLGLNRGRVGGAELMPRQFDQKVFPVAAVGKARTARLEGRIFGSWPWGGYIMYSWPGARVHVDPLKFNRRTMRSYSLIRDARPGWNDELARWNVRTIIIESDSRLARELAHDPRWKTWYRDSTAVVFRPAGGGYSAPRAVP